ncbi:MAG: hypothetical protein ACUVRC_03605 [Desulfotomaculales bacterium]
MNGPNVYYIHDLAAVKALKNPDSQDRVNPDSQAKVNQESQHVVKEEYSEEHVVVVVEGQKQAVKHALSELRRLAGEEPPLDVIREVARQDVETITAAVMAVQQYAEHNRVDNLYGLLLEALRGAWKPGPRAGPARAGKNKPRPARRHADTIRDETKQALRSLYL